MNKFAYFIIGIILIGISICIFLYFNTTIYIAIDPADAQITLNGTQITAKAKTKFTPGTYTLKVQKADYLSYEENIDLGLGANASYDIALRLLPVPQKMATDQAKFSSLTSDKASIYYLSSGGKTMYALEDLEAEKTTSEAISPSFFADVINIIWAPNHELAIVKQKDKTMLYDFSRYDLLHQELLPFESGIGDIVWSADSQNIIYYFAPANGETTLIKATKNNQDMERIYNFRDTKIRNPKLDWSPDGLDVLVAANNQLYILNLYTKNLVLLPIGEAIEARFTPDNKILFINKDGASICDKSGNDIVKLDFNTDLQRLSFFDSNTIIYAQKNNNIYQFYAYNLAKNTKTNLVYNTKYQIDPTDIILSANRKYLYFESGGYLYRVAVDAGNY